MKKALLTGHSKGLGGAIAAALLARQIPVLGLSRSRHPDLAARFPGLLEETEIDLADAGALSAWLESGALAKFLAGSEAALLINNAGMLAPMGPAGTLAPQAIAQAVSLNVAAPLMLANGFATASGNAIDRRILHISSGAARSPYPGWNIYCATKAALDHHARSVALENVPALRICSLAPGVVDTDMQAQIRATDGERFPLRERFVTLKQEGLLARPDEAAAKMVDYLLEAGFGRQPVADLREV